jgi:hypothetical protein
MANRALLAVAAVALTAGLAMGGLAATGQLPYGEPEAADRSFVPKAFVIDDSGFVLTGDDEFDRCFRAAYGGTGGRDNPAGDSGACAAHRLGDRWLLPGSGLSFGYDADRREYDLPTDYYLKRQPL